MSFFLRLLKLISSPNLSKKINNVLNDRILNDVRKLSSDEEYKKVEILSTVINPSYFPVLNIGLSTPNIVVDTYVKTIDQQIKDLKKIIYNLKHKKRISSLLTLSEIHTVKAHLYFRTIDNYFLDIEKSVEELISLTKEFSILVGELKGSDAELDRENYYSLRGYITNVYINLESLINIAN